MNQSKAQEIIAQLLANAAGLQYGSVSVTIKLHESKVVAVCHSTTENTREQNIRIDEINS